MKIRIKRLEIDVALRPVVGFRFYYRYVSVRKVRQAQGYYLTTYGFGQSVSFQKPRQGRHPFWRHDLPWHNKVQLWLQGIGINACDPFSQECTPDMSCCMWSSTPEEAALLSSLVSQCCPGDACCDDKHKEPGTGVYITGVGIGICKICGSRDDLRMGICFGCSDKVVGEEDPVSGMTKITQKGHPENWWLVPT